MTPQQLRENARQHVADARTLLPTSPKNAAYLAGYAVEFMLKARYCTLRGWPRFPTSVGELKAWNARDGVTTQDRLFVHDLNELLRLSDTVGLRQTAFHHIDWGRACDWSEQLRYEPLGTVAQDDAAALIAEADNVVRELTTFEVLHGLLAIELELTRRFGLFHCFALVVHPETQLWTLLLAWYDPDQETADARARELSSTLAIPCGQKV